MVDRLALLRGTNEEERRALEAAWTQPDRARRRAALPTPPPVPTVSAAPESPAPEPSDAPAPNPTAAQAPCTAAVAPPFPSSPPPSHSSCSSSPPPCSPTPPTRLSPSLPPIRGGPRPLSHLERRLHALGGQRRATPPSRIRGLSAPAHRSGRVRAQTPASDGQSGQLHPAESEVGYPTDAAADAGAGAGVGAEEEAATRLLWVWGASGVRRSWGWSAFHTRYTGSRA